MILNHCLLIKGLQINRVRGEVVGREDIAIDAVGVGVEDAGGWVVVGTGGGEGGATGAVEEEEAAIVDEESAVWGRRRAVSGRAAGAVVSTATNRGLFWVFSLPGSATFSHVMELDRSVVGL